MEDLADVQSSMMGFNPGRVVQVGRFAFLNDRPCLRVVSL